ncbi:ribosomal protein L7 [Chloropicon primus]|uniref:H/ACA ribonucleoprotein complex subunit 2 n=1 Tax=Chloropicon primus TaxID=1764295 RepID=A0A5B8MXF0_9CHLO|nr:ribosomal protein L7 [Chloropicon primus]UPR03583.1 ribosomal protein L7 [Chloropicon primus]|eukprot:QDZ24375.1 ribosomal protein L7 [Chloropicon primus]
MGTTRLVSPIAKPMADDKLNKKILKAVKKAAKVKALKRGVKEVVKAVRKGSKGTCIIAGDVSPIDVLSHVPVLCEDNEVPYVFVPSKEELGAAGLTKRPTSCILLLPKPWKESKDTDKDDVKKYVESYDEINKKAKDVALVF